MMFSSSVFRFLFHKYQVISSILRVTKLNLLYPGAKIDYKTKIGANCNIVCVKGGKLYISNCDIKEGTHIFADANSTIFIKGSFIGRNCVITAKEKVLIKKDCLIAEMVVIRDQDHVLGILNEEIPTREFYTAPIEIEENVWIASKATILKGVAIGKNSIIAASAVVTKDVPAGEIWAGIPAKFLKYVVSK